MKNKIIRRVLTLVIGASMLLGVVGCGQSGEAEAEASDVSEQSDTLTVYMNDFDAVIADLYKEKTGNELNIVTGNGAEIMSKIEAEKGNPQWDVVWADMMPSIHRLMDDGQLLTDYEPENAAALTEFAATTVPEEQGYWPTGAHAASVLVYRNDIIDEANAPSDIFELDEQALSLGMADPGVAAPAYPMASYFFEELGLEEGKAYFSTLFDNGLKVYPKNPQVVQALASGEVEAALLQESNAYTMVNDGEPISIVWPEDGAPASVRVAAISASTEKEELAKEFVNFLLDPEVQQELINTGEEAYFEPSVTGVEMKEDRAATNPKLVYSDAAWSAENEGEIKGWFADMSVQ